VGHADGDHVFGQNQDQIAGAKGSAGARWHRGQAKNMVPGNWTRRAMDWVDAWKAVSVVLTGVFGMLGLLTEFKHPETKQITRWGRVSLAGIILSSAAPRAP
jgi:hypothetical protein